ncbi:MAG: TonB family protein [Bryobacteraceae bacterium]|nr:TonB family protein [Bryobacteraceae bacterium]
MLWSEASWFAVFAGVAVKSTAVLAAAWAAALLLRKRSAAARCLVWTAASAAVIALPFLSVSLPEWRVGGVSAFLPAASSAMFSVSGSAADGARAAAPESNAAAASQPGSWRLNWTAWPAPLAALGTAALLVRMVIAWRLVRRLRRKAAPFADRHLGEALARALGIRQQVEVLESAEAGMPMTCGLWRPVILLPSGASEWSEDRLRMVLLHELAHVRRGDVATHLLARAAFALCWWNPLAWRGWREFLKERERAADDMALTAGVVASDYASQLLEIARSMRCGPGARWAAVTMARRSQLEGRLIAILDTGIDRKPVGRASALAAAMLAVALAAPLAAVRAQAGQEAQAEAIPADVEVAIRSASAQKNPELLESAATAAVQALKYDIARKLMEGALAIRAEVSGADSVDVGLTLLKLADIESRRGMGQSADELYARAARILGERPEAARALMRLGVAAVIRKDSAAAVEHFERARRLDPARAGMALMWMAVAAQREANINEAGRLYPMALAAQDPRSPEAVTIGRVYSSFLRRQGRNDEAAEVESRAAFASRAVARQAREPAAGVHRVSEGATPPRLVQKQEPEYTEEARAAKLEGKVVLYAEVAPDGLAHNIQVLEGLGLGLDEKAMEAISQWRFNPGAREGQPVTVAATIEVNYRLF